MGQARGSCHGARVCDPANPGSWEGGRGGGFSRANKCGQAKNVLCCGKGLSVRAEPGPGQSSAACTVGRAGLRVPGGSWAGHWEGHDRKIGDQRIVLSPLEGFRVSA